MRFIIIIALFAAIGCSTGKYEPARLLPYLNTISESQTFVDSLLNGGTDSIIVYHKKHGHHREYFIFWVDSAELQLRNIRATGTFKIGDWNRNGFYRDLRLFEFYALHREKMLSDTIAESGWSHYPYVDIKVILNDSTTTFHLPGGINSRANSTPYHFARLIESTIYNLSNSNSWWQAEGKVRFYPKGYNPTKEKWQSWEREKINTGEIWEDMHH